MHLAGLTLLFTSASLFLIARCGSSSSSSAHDHRSAYAAIPLQEIPDGQSKVTRDRQRLQNHALSSPSLLILIVVGAIALSLRIATYREVVRVSECASRNVEVWLPLLVAVYDAIRFQKPTRLQAGNDEDDLEIDSNISSVTRSWKNSLLQSRWRFVPAALLFSLGCHMVTGLWSSSQSTIICPRSSTDLTAIPNIQWLNLVLDTLLVVVAFELGLGGMLPSSPILAIPSAWATVTTLAASVWLGIAFFVYKTQPEHRAWLFMEPGPGRSTIFSTLLWQSAFLSILLTSPLNMVGRFHCSTIFADSFSDYKRRRIIQLCPSHRHCSSCAWVETALVYAASLSPDLVFSFDLVFRAYVHCLVSL